MLVFYNKVLEFLLFFVSALRVFEVFRAFDNNHSCLGVATIQCSLTLGKIHLFWTILTYGSWHVQSWKLLLFWGLSRLLYENRGLLNFRSSAWSYFFVDLINHFSNVCIRGVTSRISDFGQKFQKVYFGFFNSLSLIMQNWLEIRVNLLLRYLRD